MVNVYGDIYVTFAASFCENPCLSQSLPEGTDSAALTHPITLGVNPRIPTLRFSDDLGARYTGQARLWTAATAPGSGRAKASVRASQSQLQQHCFVEFLSYSQRGQSFRGEDIRHAFKGQN